MPAAVAAAAPPEEPPGVRRGPHGLRGPPYGGLSAAPLHASPEQLVIPTRTAPALRILSPHHASRGATKSLNRREPCDPRQPAAQRLSFRVYGTPASGRNSREATRRSTSSASAKERSASICTTALSPGLRNSMILRAAAHACRAVRSPRRTCAPISRARVSSPGLPAIRRPPALLRPNSKPRLCPAAPVEP